VEKAEPDSPQRCIAKAQKVMVGSYASEILMRLKGKKFTMRVSRNHHHWRFSEIA